MLTAIVNDNLSQRLSGTWTIRPYEPARVSYMWISLATLALIWLSPTPKTQACILVGELSLCCTSGLQIKFSNSKTNYVLSQGGECCRRSGDKHQRSLRQQIVVATSDVTPWKSSSYPTTGGASRSSHPRVRGWLWATTFCHHLEKPRGYPGRSYRTFRVSPGAKSRSHDENGMVP